MCNIMQCCTLIMDFSSFFHFFDRRNSLKVMSRIHSFCVCVMFDWQSRQTEIHLGWLNSFKKLNYLEADYNKYKRNYSTEFSCLKRHVLSPLSSALHFFLLYHSVLICEVIFFVCEWIKVKWSKRCEVI